MAKKQGGDEGEHRDELESFDGDDGALEAKGGGGPFAEELFVLAADTALGPMGADGDEAEHGVEVKARERAQVAADAQLAFDENGLGEEGGRESGGDGEQDEGRGGGSKPEDAGGGGADAEGGLQSLADLVREETEAVDDVPALGHVGDEAAVKVAVGEFRDFGEEGEAEAVFHLAAEAERA